MLLVNKSISYPTPPFVCQQNALKGEGEQNLAAQLSSGDRALAWLCLLHVTEFGQLPSGLCDPADSGPSRVVCTKPDPFPWSSATTLRTPADQLVGLFQGNCKQNVTVNKTNGVRFVSHGG